MPTTEDREARRLSKAIIGLMRQPKFAFYSGALMMGRTYIDDATPTAYTDGVNRKFGRAFVKQLKDKELAFVVLHECMHDLYMHLSVWRKLYDEDRELANQACDYVINGELMKLDPSGATIAMPMDANGNLMGCYNPAFAGMNSKQVFDILKQNRDSGGGGGGGGGGKGFDEHGWDAFEKLSPEDKAHVAREVDRAIRQGVIAAKKAGAEAGGMHRELSDLTRPQLDWKELLREFVKTSCRSPDVSSWRRPNRRFLALDDTYMPSLIGETVGKIVVGVDTSGSIGSDDLAKFLAEVGAICTDVKPEEVDLVYWDTRVAAHENYTRDELHSLVQSTKPKGGGGTRPSCVTNWLTESKRTPECCIMLTDGCVGSDWGGVWPCPVLWCIVGGGRAEAAQGKTVFVD
jgi:hypothetical protein